MQAYIMQKRLVLVVRKKWLPGKKRPLFVYIFGGKKISYKPMYLCLMISLTLSENAPMKEELMHIKSIFAVDSTTGLVI